MTSQGWMQKLHTVDTSLPKSGYCFWLVEAGFPRHSRTNQKYSWTPVTQTLKGSKNRCSSWRGFKISGLIKSSISHVNIDSLIIIIPLSWLIITDISTIQYTVECKINLSHQKLYHHVHDYTFFFFYNTMSAFISPTWSCGEKVSFNWMQPVILFFMKRNFPPPPTLFYLPASQVALRAGTLLLKAQQASRYTSFCHTFSLHVVSQMNISPALEKLTQMTVEDEHNNFASRAFAGNNFANSATI